MTKASHWILFCAPGKSRAIALHAHRWLRSEGTIRAVYRKIHLYDVPMVGLVESQQVVASFGSHHCSIGFVRTIKHVPNQAIAGAEVVSCDSPCGKLGNAHLCCLQATIKTLRAPVTETSCTAHCCVRACGAEVSLEPALLCAGRICPRNIMALLCGCATCRCLNLL
jgi:hypothetical protein